jgi:hypothetical protein
MENEDSGDFRNFKRAVGSVLIIVIAGWLGWVSVCAIAYDKRISVVESVVTYIKEDISEMKALVKDIRSDQVRRERKENGRGDNR